VGRPFEQVGFPFELGDRRPERVDRPS